MKDEAKATNENVAKHLKKIRHQEKLTMRALAQLINTPHSFIGKVEKQGRRMDVGEFVHYCRAMNREPDAVLKEVMGL